jgi:DinB superfamily
MATATATHAEVGEVRVLREQVKAINGVLRANAEGLTEADGLVQPQPGGNCLNWVVGHLLETWEMVLPLVGQGPVLGREGLTRYKRGSEELHEAGEALPLEDLLAACEEAAKRMDAGLASLTEERLDEVAPFSPRKKADETVRSLLSLVMFHQAYHVGQTGLLRRMAGKEGKIK